MLAAQICDLEEDWESNVSLENIRELSVKGKETTRYVMNGFRDIKKTDIQGTYRLQSSVMMADLFGF